MHWKELAKRNIKAKLKDANMNYVELKELLRDIGVEEAQINLANKVNRGTFNYMFVLQIEQAIKNKKERIELIDKSIERVETVLYSYELSLLLDELKENGKQMRKLLSELELDVNLQKDKDIDKISKQGHNIIFKMYDLLVDADYFIDIIICSLDEWEDDCLVFAVYHDRGEDFLENEIDNKRYKSADYYIKIDNCETKEIIKGGTRIGIRGLKKNLEKLKEKL